MTVIWTGIFIVLSLEPTNITSKDIRSTKNLGLFKKSGKLQHTQSVKKYHGYCHRCDHTHNDHKEWKQTSLKFAVVGDLIARARSAATDLIGSGSTMDPDAIAARDHCRQLGIVVLCGQGSTPRRLGQLPCGTDPQLQFQLAEIQALTSVYLGRAERSWCVPDSYALPRRPADVVAEDLVAVGTIGDLDTAGGAQNPVAIAAWTAHGVGGGTGGELNADRVRQPGVSSCVGADTVAQDDIAGAGVDLDTARQVAGDEVAGTDDIVVGAVLDAQAGEPVADSHGATQVGAQVAALETVVIRRPATWADAEAIAIKAVDARSRSTLELPGL